jgi:hypothetical protein
LRLSKGLITFHEFAQQNCPLNYTRKISDDTDNVLSRGKFEITPRKKSYVAPYAAHTNFDKNADLSGFAGGSRGNMRSGLVGRIGGYLTAENAHTFPPTVEDPRVGVR